MDLWLIQFQSTRPSRGETTRTVRKARTRPNFNPLAPRGARRFSKHKHVTAIIFQSTRPSRGETGQPLELECGDYISIHSPLAGRDSTVRLYRCDALHFNPLAPRGARLLSASIHPGQVLISIHSPLAGRDRMAMTGSFATSTFQSTRPSRGETIPRGGLVIHTLISIHSPLAGRDSKKS